MYIKKGFYKKRENFWTKEKCQVEALKYNTRQEFIQAGYPYQAARIAGWLEDICSHMTRTTKPKGYWSKERCHQEALKYKTRKGFSDACKSAHGIASRNGWLDEICSHMKYAQSGMLMKSRDYWTKERCHKEALIYKVRNDLRKNNQIAYKISLDSGWLDEICSHMKVVGNMYKRCIYAYEFPDQHVYVGLTYDIDKRNEIHLNHTKSPVFKHISTTALQPKLKQLTDYLQVDEAKTAEGMLLDGYKQKDWTILNVNKTGGIGGNKKWTMEKCRQIALNYISPEEFFKNDRPCYQAIMRYKWSEVMSHMVRTRNQAGYWTKEKCQQEALKYNTRKDFYDNDILAYNAAVRHKWIAEICGHMSNKWKR